MSDPENPNLAEVKPGDESILHQMEVVSRALDTIPSNSGLGRYLAQPARIAVHDGDKPVTYIDADYPKMDEVKDNVEDAIGDYMQGEVGTVRIMYGMVNAMYHVREYSKDNPNLRIAFEDLAHFNITGSHNFHSMMNPAGETVGKLEPEPVAKGWGVGSENGAVLAKGAARILDGDICVMFNDYEDKPHDKMYGMRDPETGKLLPNTFMVIMSSTFWDSKGSDSPLSNISTARIVTIPQEMIDAARQPEVDLQVGSKTELTEDDWKKLEDGQFRVKRSTPEGQPARYDQGGWTIKRVFEDGKGVTRAEITSWDSVRGPVSKEPRLETLLSWQKED